MLARTVLFFASLRLALSEMGGDAALAARPDKSSASAISLVLLNAAPAGRTAERRPRVCAGASLSVSSACASSRAGVVVERVGRHRLAVAGRAGADVVRARKGGPPRDRLCRRVVRRVARGRLPVRVDRDRTERLHRGTGAVGGLVQRE